MLSGISGAGSYSTYSMNPYRGASRNPGAASAAQQSQNTLRTGNTSNPWAVRRPSNLNTPVQPVDAVKRVNPDAQPAGIDQPLSVRQGADPAEMAVRMRIVPYEEDGESVNPPLPDKEDAKEAYGTQGAEAAQEAKEEGECQTCEKRKYQDGSDDASVSFQTPTNIKPGQVAAAVRGHEMEHVLHEQAKAKQEGRKVVSQSVTLHTAICPECGKVYISGGETRTTTKANPEKIDAGEEEGQEPARKTFSIFG